MNRAQGNKASVVVSLLFLTLAFAYQNCSPAKLSGTSDGSSTLVDQASTIGTVVDLASLISADNEPAANVIYVPQTFNRTAAYAESEPVIENIILKANDFSRIDWVQESSSTVVAVGDAFNELNYSSAMAGNYLIVGYRSGKPYQIGKLLLTDKGSTSLAVTSVGAYTINQKLVETVGDSHTYLLEVSAPNVNLRSIQFTNKTTGQEFHSRRALLVQKKLAEALNIEVKLTDSNDQSSTRTVSLAATAQPVTTTTTTLPPVVVTTTTTTMPPVVVTTTTTTTVPPQITGLYNIKSRINTSFCADLDASLAANGTRFYIWSCIAGLPNQTFTFTAAKEIRIHGKCMDQTTAVDGAQLQINDCNGSATQKFTWDSANGMLRGANNQCVDVYGGTMANRTNLNMYTCNNTNPNQKFNLTATTCSIPAWVEYQQYWAGEVVLYQGKNYYAKADNPGYIPTVSTFYWAEYAGCK